MMLLLTCLRASPNCTPSPPLRIFALSESSCSLVVDEGPIRVTESSFRETNWVGFFLGSAKVIEIVRSDFKSSSSSATV